MIVLWDVAVILKMKIGCWILALVCRSVDYSQRYSALCRDIFFLCFPKPKISSILFSDEVFFFVSQGDSVVVSREKKTIKGRSEKAFSHPRHYQ